MSTQSTEKPEHLRIGRYLNRAVKALLIADVLVWFISAFVAKLVTMLLIMLLILKFLSEKYKWEQRLEKFKWFRKLKFLLNLRKLKKQSRSINQTQVFLAKYLLNLPIENNEEEVKAFNDLVGHYGKKWPFMVPVKDTREGEVTVKGKKVKCISSYSYMDLCRDERVQEAAIAAAKRYSTGNHGPRMLCGNLEILETLEERIAHFFKREAALVFSSGYLACLSVIAGIARKDDLVLMDKLSHASLKAGAKLSSAKIAYFKHNDFKHAEKVIKSQKYQKLIVVIEGVYSMDGDVGKLDEARAFCDKHNATLILDEAHSIGAIGKTGRGTEEMYDWKYKADIICGTFTKTIASVGGYIACSKELRTFYTFYGPGVVFSAPLSAYHAGAADKAFEIILQEPERVQKLQSNAEYLRKKFTENKFNIGDTISCVIPVIFRDTVQALSMHHWLLDKKGYFTALVMAPACPVTAPRFRITPTSAMTLEELDNIVEIFKEAREAVKENDELRELLDGM